VSDDQPVAGAPGSPRIARYAQGADYHDTYAAPLQQLEAEIKRIGGPNTQAKWYQDTGPFLERAIAQQAGLGWVGKNTMLIDTKHGSWSLLALVVTSLDLPPDAAGADHCGTCTRCLQACPTGAFPAPYQLDATRCISYLTIEHKGPIDETLRAGVGDWVFGCDICNEVCPWNRETDRPAGHGQPLLGGLTLSRILTAKPEHLIKRIAGTPLERTGGGTDNPVGHLKRNAAIAAGNARDEKLLPALERALQTDDELVQEAAIWALEQYGAAARSVMARAQRYVGNKDLRERVIATLQRQQEPGAVRDANEPQARTASRGTTG
jgi:epoxyqueuosine reductase